MARQIFAEANTQEKPVQEDQEKKTVEHSTPISQSDEEQVIITADEMTKLLNEWDATGRNDLSVNHTLGQRIEEYLDYQDEMDPLRAKLAERIYKPYIVNPSDNNLYRTKVYLNNDFICTARAHVDTNAEIYTGVMNLSTFKTILIALQNPYAPWIQTNENIAIDVKSYIIKNGGTFEDDYSDDILRIRL